MKGKGGEGIRGLGFRVWGLGFGVWGLGFRVSTLTLVQGLGFGAFVPSCTAGAHPRRRADDETVWGTLTPLVQNLLLLGLWFWGLGVDRHFHDILAPRCHGRILQPGFAAKGPGLQVFPKEEVKAIDFEARGPAGLFRAACRVSRPG